jgi:hypothetical protein
MMAAQRATNLDAKQTSWILVYTTKYGSASTPSSPCYNVHLRYRKVACVDP